MSTPEEQPTPEPSPEPPPAPSPGAELARPAGAAGGAAAARPGSSAGGVYALVAAFALAALAATFALRPGGAGADADVGRLVAQANEVASDPARGPAQALPLLLQALERAPDDPQVNRAAGMALTMANRFDEALPCLDRAAAAAPEDAEVALLRGMCLTGLERHADARGALEAARRLRPDDPRPLYYLGIGAMRLDDLEATVGYLGPYLEQVANPVALTIHVDALDRLGRSAEAIEVLGRVARTPAARGDVLLRRDLQDRRAVVHGQARAIELAREDLAAAGEAATAIDRYLLGRALTHDPAQLAAAREALEAARAADPRSPWPALALAVEDLRDGRLDAARAALEELRAALPDLREPLLHLARLEREAGRAERALEHTRALAAQGAGAAALQGELGALLDLGRDDDALAAARAVPPPDAPPGHGARWHEAHVLTALGRYDEALAVTEAIAAAAPADRRGMWEANAALVELEAGRPERAVERTRRALEAFGEQAPAGVLLWAGVALREVDPERARALWTQGADGDPCPPDGLWTWACRRLVGRASEDELRRAARYGGRIDRNDALLVEALARLAAGDAEGARAAAREGLEASLGGRELPAAQLRRLAGE